MWTCAQQFFGQSGDSFEQVPAIVENQQHLSGREMLDE
ncbi:hypothetical protein GFS60_07440 (plasmid) [Rhodococcus sp. WAY2]|nr:hypothetical protein GFS60_07440 [Rhodococcus sp. WAY2]